jgi:hypothetical protein
MCGKSKKILNFQKYFRKFVEILSIFSKRITLKRNTKLLVNVE